MDSKRKPEETQRGTRVGTSKRWREAEKGGALRVGVGPWGGEAGGSAHNGVGTLKGAPPSALFVWRVLRCF